MKHRYSILALASTILVSALLITSCGKPQYFSDTKHSSASNAPAMLTRAEVIRIVRHEVQREFALRDWHHYSGYIDEYTGADANALFSLTTLDRATATGNTSANVRVIVYEDYECPFCKVFETQTAPGLQRKFHSRALFVYRFFPLEIHGKVAHAEAVAGACVARIGGPVAFRRFTHTVFATTGTNGKGTPTPTEKIAKTALRGYNNANAPKNLDTIYDKCTQGKLGASLIAVDSSFKGVSGTPTIFVVNIEQHQAWRLAGALPAWVFDALITNAIAGKTGHSDWAIEQRSANSPGLHH